jgi:hypothetical protein
MDLYWNKRKITILWALTLLGLAYSGWLQFHGTLTGADQVDGSIGVVFGLYISSHPAAFIVDLLFFRRSTVNGFSSDRSLVLWAILNLMVLLVGWFVIFIGTTLLIGRAEAIL